MIPDKKNIKSKYISFLSNNFFNKNLEKRWKAESGLIKELDNTIEKFSKDLEKSFIDFTKSCKVKNLIVSGGGGAPGKWSGGIGIGGGISFNFKLNIEDEFDYSLHKIKNRIIEEEIEKTINVIFNSLIFTKVQFGDGTSSHTDKTPGALTKANSISDKIGNMAKIPGLENIQEYKDLDKNIIKKLESNNFNIMIYIEDDIKAIRLLLHYLIDYWISNTDIKDIKATGGVTTMLAGVLSNGVGTGGNFI